jgi:shikimate dehydrogenase
MSPLIHSMIASVPLNYELFDIAPDMLEMKVNNELTQLTGFNVTIPYKKSILNYCHEFDSAVLRLGAANTISIRGTKHLKAYNTDYPAFIRVVHRYIPDYLSYHPVIMGYGGVARAAVFGLENLNYVCISLINGKFDHERRAFLDEIRHEVKLQILDNIPDSPRLWINCTPAGNINNPKLPRVCSRMREGDFLFDLNYMPRPTYLQQFAEEKGLKHINGMRMLIFQAIEAQKIWLGKSVMDEREIDTILHKISL